MLYFLMTHVFIIKTKVNGIQRYLRLIGLQIYLQKIYSWRKEKPTEAQRTIRPAAKL